MYDGTLAMKGFQHVLIIWWRAWRVRKPIGQREVEKVEIREANSYARTEVNLSENSAADYNVARLVVLCIPLLTMLVVPLSAVNPRQVVSAKKWACYSNLPNLLPTISAAVFVEEG